MNALTGLEPVISRRADPFRQTVLGKIADARRGQDGLALQGGYGLFYILPGRILCQDGADNDLER